MMTRKPIRSIPDHLTRCQVCHQPAKGHGWFNPKTPWGSTARTRSEVAFCSTQCQWVFLDHKEGSADERAKTLTTLEFITTQEKNTMDTHLVSDQITHHIDNALQSEHQQETPRTYLGGSRLGVACERALQYEYLKTPVDKPFPGRILRIFAAGHVFEELAIDWLRMAGFDLHTQTSTGGQYGFSAVDGRIKGHVDGILASGPNDLNMTYPALWECKSAKNSAWNDLSKRGLTIANPIYAAQVALYQAYMEEHIPGISQNPALFMAINKDTAQLYCELIPFNGELAQRSSDKGVRILAACDANDSLPRIARDPSHFGCKFCSWRSTCWQSESTNDGHSKTNITSPSDLQPLIPTWLEESA